MTPSTCTNAALRRATRRMSQLYDDMLKPSGLRATQYTLLAALSRHTNPTMTTLAADLAMDRSALNHSLAPLVIRGLVIQEPDPTDARAKRVRLTGAGAKRLDQAEPLWRKAERRLESTFGVAAALDLRRLLDQIAAPEFAREFERA